MKKQEPLEEEEETDLPEGRQSTATSKAVKIRRKSKDAMDLVPPFASPPKHESILGTSVEHAVPSELGLFSTCFCMYTIANCFFRAQEPKAPVTYCDHALSGVRPSSVVR